MRGTKLARGRPRRHPGDAHVYAQTAPATASGAAARPRKPDAPEARQRRRRLCRQRPPPGQDGPGNWRRQRHWPGHRRGLRARGADVAIAYLDEHSDARETVRLVEEAGRKCVSLAGDLADVGHAEAVAARVLDAFGRLDILVNNAAEQHPKSSLEDVEAEQVEATFRTNVYAMFHLTRACCRICRAGRPFSTPPRSPPTAEVRTCSTTRQPRAPSCHSRVRWRCRWSSAASA